MSKRTSKNLKKGFNFDLDSLFDFSLEEKKENQTLNDSFNHAKKFKKTDPEPTTSIGNGKEKNFFQNESVSKKDECNLNETEMNDYTKVFGNVNTDFSRTINGRKEKLNQFTESVISLYEKKITEILTKMESEEESFKERATNSIQEEISKFEEEFSNLQLHETKLMKILEQQVQLLQKSYKFQEQWSETFNKMHQNFLKEFMELKQKHKENALNMKKSIEAEVTELQNKFIKDLKKEEMETMRKYIASVYY